MEIYRNDDDVFWQKVGRLFLAGGAALLVYVSYGIVTWALGVGCWNW